MSNYFHLPPDGDCSEKIGEEREYSKSSAENRFCLTLILAPEEAEGFVL